MDHTSLMRMLESVGNLRQYTDQLVRLSVVPCPQPERLALHKFKYERIAPIGQTERIDRTDDALVRERPGDLDLTLKPGTRCS